MKYAVYAIAKNEEKHVNAWVDSTRDADYRLVCDTGSTDSTPEALRDNGVTVQSLQYSYFRFDDARNAALSFLPSDIDYCISLDLDETLCRNWKDSLLEAASTNPCRINHSFETDWGDGQVSRHYHERVHCRHGYRWFLPVHEKLVWYNREIKETVRWATDFTIHHRPDRGKDRSQYLQKLELAITEPFGKDDWKVAFFLAEEYLSDGQYEMCKNMALRTLLFGDVVWPAQQRSLLEMISKCDDQLLDTPGI